MKKLLAIFGVIFLFCVLTLLFSFPPYSQTFVLHTNKRTPFGVQ